MDEEEAKALQAGAPKKQRGRPRKLAPIRTMRDALAEWIAEEQRPTGRAVWTGFPTLDAAIGKPFRLGEVVQIAARTGVGKALEVHEPVLTPLGWVPIGSLRAGDDVMAASGQAARVVGVFPQGVGETWRMRFAGGESVLCSPEHLWRVWHYKGYEEVLTTAEIAERAVVGEARRPRWFLPNAEPLEHPEAELPIEPYALGVLLGDGCFRGGQVSFTNPEPEIAEMVAVHVPISRHRSSPVPTFGVVDKNATREVLRDLDLWGRYSYEKHVPDVYLYASVEQRRALLAGLLDTDGYALKNGVTQFAVSSKPLCDAVEALARSLGGHVRRSEKMTVSGRLSYIATLSMPENPFRLPRKAARWQRHRQMTRRAILGVDRVGDTDRVCIAIDDPTRCYVTRGYVVTHNSWMVQHLVELALAADPEALVVGFPLEMPAFQMAERHAARALGVDPAAAARKAAAGEITPAEVVQRNPALDRIVMYEAGTRASDLPHVVERAAEHFERWPTIVYVDYFGLLGKEDPRAPRYEAASDNARMLKEVAKDVKCVVLCAAQLSRQGSRDGTAPPTLDSLRDSGVIEEAADRVLALWRDEETPEDRAEVRNEIRIKVLKNRFGPAGAQALLRFSSTLALEEVDEYAAGSPF